MRAVEGTLERLRGAGARVRDVSIPSGARLYDEMFEPIAVSEIRATYARAFRARPDAFSKDFAAVFDGPGRDCCRAHQRARGPRRRAALDRGGRLEMWTSS